ncbi:hypothetical protein HMPREF9622_00599 [Cutibacterium modestum HL037PA3]|uniref:Uncharacterized protein n=1 Tax=Cutibacterium modestum HL044PA1 TaxID=765109 RepID=A0ABP2KDJ1_9ACTN|nr:hypothetical protein HMPREF9607_00155 [Cutibacterium modestum HL044PA1]EFT16394.1 hypothetical protein HMPREF9622_00599 [Cutibacterium modestum HL037PA3]
MGPRIEAGSKRVQGQNLLKSSQCDGEYSVKVTGLQTVMR